MCVLVSCGAHIRGGDTTPELADLSCLCIIAHHHARAHARLRSQAPGDVGFKAHLYARCNDGLVTLMLLLLLLLLEVIVLLL